MFEASYVIRFDGRQVELKSNSWDGEISYVSPAGLEGDLVNAGYLRSKQSGKGPNRRTSYYATNQLRSESQS